MNEWYETVGFKGNPLTSKPLADDAQTKETEQILSLIDQNTCVFIQAKYGRGKTALLKNIIRNFGGKRKIIYYTNVPNEIIPLDTLIKKSSMFRQFLGHMPHDMILLYDESQDISRENAAIVTGFYNAGNIRSIIFFGTQYHKGNFPAPLRKIVSKNSIKLSDLTDVQALRLIKSRVDGLISDQAIKELNFLSEGNPRRLLELCEQACYLFIHKEGDKVSIVEAEKMAKQLKPKRGAVYDVAGLHHLKND